MASNFIQSSFAGGELSPALYARTDLAKFEVGAALLRNFIVDYRGGVVNRPGTKFCYDFSDVDGDIRLIPFVVSTEASYILAFYVGTDGGVIDVFLEGSFVTSVETPYLTDLGKLKYVQSADVLTLVHPSYPPANLSRTDASTFVYEVIEFGPTIQPPTITEMRAPHSGPYNFGYLVTSVDLDGKEESLPSNIACKHSEGMNELTNRVVGFEWDAPTQPVSRYNVFKWGPIDAVTMIPATVWGFIGSAQTTTFTDNNIAPDFAKQPPSWGDPVSGGQIQSIVVLTGGSGYDGVSGDWPAIPFVPLSITGDGTEAAGYAVIDHDNGVIVGAFLTLPGKNYTTATVTADGEDGTGATFSVTFSDIAPLYPSCVSYLQQRRVYAGSNLLPDTFAMSQPGLFDNFNSTPVALDTDAIGATISSLQVNTIKSLVPVSYGLLAFTSGGCYLIASTEGQTGGISPSTISTSQQASPGANDLIPQLVNYDVLFGQNFGNRLLRAGFAWEKQSYTVSDITNLVPHLFDSYETVDWAYAQEPNKVLWVVRDDGRLLSCTYVPEQEVFAWARHDTQGQFKAICVVPEGVKNTVYFLVKRHMETESGDGCWVTYLEKLEERGECCIFDAWHLDCAVELYKQPTDILLYITQTEDPEIVDLWSYDPCIADPAGQPTFGEAFFSYVMEAKENYSSEWADILGSGSEAFVNITNDQHNIGQWYDHVRREIIYSVAIAADPNETTNITGFTLWPGDASLALAPDDPYDTREVMNKWITRRSIDSELVESFNCWSEDETVPAGIGGGDGSWRRYVNSTADFGNYPAVLDPRTGNFWQHVFGNGVLVCCVYMFRREDDYVQIISPLQVDGADVGSHYEPVGTTEDWTYCYTELNDFINPGFEAYLVLSPREITAEETTQDRLLSYAEFPFPAPMLDFTANYRFCFSHANAMYVFMVNKVGARDYVLYKFTEPSSAPWGGPVVGGGFTDASPWTSSSGPNTNIDDYVLNSGTKTNNKLMMYFLPEENTLVCITKLIPPDTGVGVTDPLLFRMDCTYADLTADSFDYHEGFVRGYMTAAWTPTEVAAEAAWAVQDVQEVNLYLNEASYLYDDVNYAKRWMFFQVQPVVGGVWTPDAAENRKIIVEYTFTPGAAPVASTIIDEQGWDDAYTTYAAAIGNTAVVENSIDITSDDNITYQNGVYDATTNSFWWAPNSNFFLFDGAFTSREDLGCEASVPLLKLSFTSPPVSPIAVGDVVLLRCGKIEITEVVNNRHLVGRIIEDISEFLIPDDPQGDYLPIDGWFRVRPSATVTGLDHLENKEVWSLADGHVVGPLTVEGGAVNLSFVASTAVVGLRYTSQIKTLYLTAEGINSGSEQGKRKNLSGVSLRVDCSRGLSCGPSFDLLTEVPDLILAGGPQLYTGDAYTTVFPDWNTKGEICIEQVYPLPASVLGVIVGVTPGDTGR